MKIEIYEDTQKLGEAEAKRIARLLKQKPDALLCVPAGASGVCVFEQLIKMNQAGEVDFSQAYIVGLDEWCDFPFYEGSARWILDTSFFNFINIDRKKMCMFQSAPANPEQECCRVEEFIRQRGGIDYIMLGVGMNGHVALNEPGVDLTEGAHVAQIASKTIEVSAKYFEHGMPVIRRGLTLGYRNIFEAKQVVMILNGQHKAPIVKKLLETPITSDFPATNIKTCGRARIVMDQAAAGAICRV